MSQVKNVFLIAFLSVTLAGCATGQKFVATNKFDPDLTQALLKEGNNTIRGSALIRQNGGGVVTCAGRSVELLPATPYSTERIEAIYRSSVRGYLPVVANRRLNEENQDPRYNLLRKESICDAQGFFKFDKVADGSFFLFSTIMWATSSIIPEGGSMMIRVDVKGGELKEVVMAP